VRTWHVERRHVVRVLLTMVGFDLVAAALASSEYQDNSGGTRLHAFLAVVAVVAAMSIPVSVAIVFTKRDRGDQMPAALVSQPPDGDTELTYALTPTFRWVGLLIAVAVAIGVPALVVASWDDRPESTVFLACLLAIATYGFGEWWQSYVTRLSLSGDTLNVTVVGGKRRSLPLTAISEVRMPPTGSMIQLEHAAGTLQIPQRMERVDQFVVELRRRNPAIRYDGTWPPRRGTSAERRLRQAADRGGSRGVARGRLRRR
jgi:hypothetical protein